MSLLSINNYFQNAEIKDLKGNMLVNICNAQVYKALLELRQYMQLVCQSILLIELLLYLNADGQLSHPVFR